MNNWIKPFPTLFGIALGIFGSPLLNSNPFLWAVLLVIGSIVGSLIQVKWIDGE